MVGVGENLLGPSTELLEIGQQTVNYFTDGLTKWLGNGLSFLVPVLIVLGVILLVKTFKK